jgi:hypothetical protein
MTQNGFELDPERLILRFKDESDVLLLSSLLRVGKFSDDLDSRVLFSSDLASLMNQLAQFEQKTDAERVERLSHSGINASSLANLRRSAHHSDAYLLKVAELIVSESESIGWREMNTKRREKFIQEIVAAPDTFSAAAVERILTNTHQLLT